MNQTVINVTITCIILVEQQNGDNKINIEAILTKHSILFESFNLDEVQLLMLFQLHAVVVNSF